MHSPQLGLGWVQGAGKVQGCLAAGGGGTWVQQCLPGSIPLSCPRTAESIKETGRTGAQRVFPNLHFPLSVNRAFQTILALGTSF